MGKMKVFFYVTDIGFLLYWLITFLHVIPENMLFKDYNNPLLVSWNWSFLPLDLLISFTGLMGLYYFRKGNVAWRNFSFVSLVLTFCSGLQAIVFWTIRLDFDWTWWLFNLYLMIYPLFFLPKLLKQSEQMR
ncbi:YvaD family protein [Sporolactobacillus shoreicorticis]|uniref:YvaD family protein n=1 Tax=Sporolactobacillus shoreicorticis TaxID=1923877 RepID=A0ABW5S355_9BACL|nr:YvaD family protein [Sporolactobacillus shoreicorticis]MCO7127085.1 YvaD family protein [Sporolactobacillus shoreicorticis]